MTILLLVHQRKKSDCGVACVAMIAGVSYQQAFDVFDFPEGSKTFYTQHSQLTKALNRLGYDVRRKMFRTWEVIPGHAIVPVNHRCNRRKFHWVVYDGRGVLDPNPKRDALDNDFKRFRASGWYLLASISNGSLKV